MSDAEDRPAKAAESGRREGARQAATGLFRVFLQQQPRLRRVAAGMGMAGADIDDVLQEVSVRVLRQPDQLEHEEAMTRWLIRITVNLCLTEHRRRFCRRATRILPHRPELEQTLTSGTPDATSPAAVTEELEIVRRTMAELDPALLELIVLRYFGDLDSGEIGRTLGLNASTVRCRLREARLILAQKLVQRGVEP